MDIVEYVEKAQRTISIINYEDFDPVELNYLLNNLHMTTGIATEGGELADVFKKKLAYGKRIDWVNVQEELGDLLWYIANFCAMNNFDLSAILQNNIDKLQARYPEKFDSNKAINRDLNKERKILEELGYSYSENDE